jgi:hypothetical protein
MATCIPIPFVIVFAVKFFEPDIIDFCKKPESNGRNQRNPAR